MPPVPFTLLRLRPCPQNFFFERTKYGKRKHKEETTLSSPRSDNGFAVNMEVEKEKGKREFFRRMKCNNHEQVVINHFYKYPWLETRRNNNSIVHMTKQGLGRAGVDFPKQSCSVYELSPKKSHEK